MPPLSSFGNTTEGLRALRIGVYMYIYIYVNVYIPSPPRTYHLGTGAFKGPLRTYYLGTWGARGILYVLDSNPNTKLARLWLRNLAMSQHLPTALN